MLIRLRLLPLLAVLAAPMAAQTATRATSPAPVKGATVEGITEYRLGNGLRVLLFPDASKPTVTVNITYLVGSRHEGSGETGMAHLLEHLLFKGTPTHRDIPKELTERGARPNGTTSLDRTNYFETVPSGDANLTWALDLEADRMVHSFVAAKDLESEMTVVRNEFELGENDPGSILRERIMSTAFLWHNYGHSPIGARADIENVPIERLQAFYRRYYQPDNAVLVVAGKFDEAKTLQLVNAKFGRIPRPVRSLDRGNLLYATYTREPVQDGERSVTLRRVGDNQVAMVGYHIPSLAHPDNPPLQVLATLLSASPNGRLYKSLVEAKLASDVSAFTVDLREPGMLFASAELRTEQSLDTARDVLLRTIDGAISTVPTVEEVERAKNELVKHFEQLLDNSEQVGYALTEAQASGDWRLLHISRDRLKAVTPADVQRVAAAYLKPDNRTVGVFVPTPKPDRAEIPEGPVVETLVRGYTGTQTVAQGEAFTATPAVIDARTIRKVLPNGMRVTMLPKKSRGGVVFARVTLRLGTEQALMNRANAGGMVSSLLDRGTQLRSRQALKDTLDKLKATVRPSGSAVSAAVSIQVKRENLVPTMELVAELLRRPAFDSTELETARNEQLAQLESGRSDPQALAVLAMQRVLAPRAKGHPEYVPESLDEAIGMVKAVTLADVKAFHAEFYGAQSGDVSVIGDVEPTEITALATRLFGDWTAKAPWVRIPNTYVKSDSALISIETPDKANAIFFAVQRLDINDGDSTYAATQLGTAILGGGFLKSRLADRIRQRDGLSYGVGSQLNAPPWGRAGAMLSYAIYAPQNIDRLQVAFREELDRLLRDGITADELDAARKGWLGAKDQQLANDDELVGTLTVRRAYDRTFTGYDQVLADRVRKLTVADVNAALRHLLDPTQMVLVRAGDFVGAKRKTATLTP
ncbi:MAG: insulinase family protein [Gemmatimonadaceae bacterium]|nr:insulinase family protein [Gemmatimonadaceae bacterium]